MMISYSHDDDDEVVDSKDTLFHDAMKIFLIAFWNSLQVWICPLAGGWLLRETNLQLEGFIISIFLHRIMSGMDDGTQFEFILGDQLFWNRVDTAAAVSSLRSCSQRWVNIYHTYVECPMKITLIGVKIPKVVAALPFLPQGSPIARFIQVFF